MSIRTIERDEWTSIIKKDIRMMDIAYHHFTGKASLLKMIVVSEDIYIGNLAIVKKDYNWLQIALKDQYFWFTCMFDEKGELFQIYIDMTMGNHVDDNQCYFKDAYLDFIMDENQIIELDKDELFSAKENKLISNELFDLIIKEGNQLKEYLVNNQKEVIDDIKSLYKKLATTI